jgi:hypothetical protein
MFQCALDMTRRIIRRQGIIRLRFRHYFQGSHQRRLATLELNSWSLLTISRVLQTFVHWWKAWDVELLNVEIRVHGTFVIVLNRRSVSNSGTLTALIFVVSTQILGDSPGWFTIVRGLIKMTKKHPICHFLTLNLSVLIQRLVWKTEQA